MTDAVIVLCTFANQEDAVRVAGTVVEARLAACVNILGPMQSIYRWEGEIERADEILALIKTTERGFPALRDHIKELHPYQTPEIIALPVLDGLSAYLGWMREQIS